MRRSHTRYTEISSPCVIKSCLILSLLLLLLHEQIHIYIDGTYSKTFLLNSIKLQNKQNEVDAKQMSILSSTTSSHVFRGVARICSEVRTFLQMPLTPSATSPPPPPPMSPNVEVTVSLSVFTVSKITSCVYFHVLRTTSHIKKISRRGRAGTAKKCTKKRAKHAKNCSTF